MNRVSSLYRDISCFRNPISNLYLKLRLFKTKFNLKKEEKKQKKQAKDFYLNPVSAL